MKRTVAYFLVVVLGCLTVMAVRIRHFGLSEGLRDSHIRVITQDTKGFVWIGTWSGLFRFDGYGFKEYRTSSDDAVRLDNNRIERIAARGDTIWLETYTHRIFSLKPATGRFSLGSPGDSVHFINVGVSNKLNPALADYPTDSCIKYVDRAGNLWLSRGGRGLELVSPDVRGVSVLRLPSVDPRGVNALYVDSQDRIWAGCRGGRVRVCRVGSDNLYLTRDGTLSSDTTAVFGVSAYAFCEDSLHRLWVGTKSGEVCILTPETDTKYRVDRFVKGRDLPFTDIYGFTIDSRGNLWAATFGYGPALLTFVDNVLTFNSFGANNWSRGKRLRNIVELDVGLMVAPTTEGLLLFEVPGANSSTISHRLLEPTVTGKGGPANSDILNIAVTDGRLYSAEYSGGVQWLPTKGLSLYSVPGMTDLKMADNELAMCVMPDSKGDIWVGTAHSVICCASSGGIKTHLLPENLGFDFTLTEAAPRTLDNGTMVFGTTEGLLLISPESFGPASCPLPTVTGIDYHENNGVTLRFSSLDFASAPAIRYAYRLKGDTHWTETGKERTIHLTNLPPGKTEIELRSTDAYGRWSDNFTTVDIDIPWTWRDRLTVMLTWGAPGVLLIIIVYQVFRFVRRTRRRRAFNNLVSLTMSFTEYGARRHLADRDVHSNFETRLAVAMAYNYPDPTLRAEKIAVDMGMARGDLRRRVRNLTGRSVEDLLRAVRVEAAARCLARGGRNISETAAVCGFKSPQYLAMVFKETKGMTPKQYAASQCKKT